MRGTGAIDHVPYPDRPWDEVVPGLWLGGVHCQYGGVAAGPGVPRPSVEGVCRPGDVFDVVVSMLHAPGCEPSAGVEHRVYRIADTALASEALRHLDEAVDQVCADLAAGRRVLVRCQAGINRSALVVGLVLVRLGWAVEDALAHLRAVRSPYVLFNESFVAYLREVQARG